MGLARIVEHLVREAVSITRPWRITMIRCESSRATARSWVTMMTARPRSATRPAHEVEEARLHRHVEAARRLVHEHEARRGHEVAGDLEPLGMPPEKVRGASSMREASISTRPSQSTAVSRMRP